MLDLLTPKYVGHEKLRLGPKEDGGYVVPEVVLEKSCALFSYGISWDDRCEHHFVNTYRKPAFLFDHTIKPKEYANPLLTFVPEGLGRGENCCDFLHHYKKYQKEGSVFLKIDIEGGEYDYFLNTDIKLISKLVYGISLEIHWVDKRSNRDNFMKIMDELLQYFTLCHVHGNNWSSLWEYKGHQIPQTFELSLINKSLVEIETQDDSKYPIPLLDFPNKSDKKDYPLTYI